MYILGRWELGPFLLFFFFFFFFFRFFMALCSVKPICDVFHGCTDHCFCSHVVTCCCPVWVTMMRHSVAEDRRLIGFGAGVLLLFCLFVWCVSNCVQVHCYSRFGSGFIRTVPKGGGGGGGWGLSLRDSVLAVEYDHVLIVISAMK